MEYPRVPLNVTLSTNFVKKGRMYYNYVIFTRRMVSYFTFIKQIYLNIYTSVR